MERETQPSEETIQQSEQNFQNDDYETLKADVVLAEETGKPRDDFSADGYELPDFEDLEVIPEEDQ
ncbi:hypothetical protein [Halorubrum pallidum]|uniref:Uncharacterized protein n=1 Tax=Halorubrum pallidum TaxID=1526114 RepID=A0ABD5T1M6_9EURY